MNRLKKPNILAKDVFMDCISNYREQKRTSLEMCVDTIENSELEYIWFMEAGRITEFVPIKCVGDVSKDDLVKVYSDKLAKRHQPGRKHYDSILSLPQNDICPYCNHMIVSTLDHYLPKSEYPTLAVSPVNLVPSCKDCNSKKSTKLAQKKEELLLNPYYEDMEDYRWLKATLVEDNDSEFLTAVFSVSDSCGADAEMLQRIKYVFSTFELGRLYASNAAQKLGTISRRCKRLIKKSGLSSVIKSIEEDLQDLQIHKNSWEVALYQELLDNNWFNESWLPRQ